MVRRAHRHGPHPAPRGRVEKGLRAFALAISRGGYGRDVDGDRAHGASPGVVQRLPEGASRMIPRLRRLASEPGPRTARPRAARAAVKGWGFPNFSRSAVAHAVARAPPSLTYATSTPPRPQGACFRDSCRYAHSGNESTGAAAQVRAPPRPQTPHAPVSARACLRS